MFKGRQVPRGPAGGKEGKGNSTGGDEEKGGKHRTQALKFGIMEKGGSHRGNSRGAGGGGQSVTGRAMEGEVTVGDGQKGGIAKEAENAE